MKDVTSQWHKIIPAHCFTSNAAVSLAYMVFDLVLFSTCLWTYPGENGHIFNYFVYWNIYGFLGWCIFVVGHDCGHGSFSSYKWLNAVCGHICHTILMVPFYPWARSHHKHHCYHNHKTEDRSHPWLTPDDFSRVTISMRKILPTVISPFVSFWVYLFVGMAPDGCHVVWFGQLYQGASKTQKFKAFISIACVFVWIYKVFQWTGSFVQFWMQYGFIISMTYFWLFMVTWFQHHDENTLVYDNNNWSFAKGALQTVDRKVGYGLDFIQHHITDCHAVHHVFFRSIPHYHLREATDALLDFKEIKRVDHSSYPLKYVVDFFSLYPKRHMTGWKWGK